MEKNNVFSTVRFVLTGVFLFGLILSAATITVLNIYKPTYRVTIDGQFVGYLAKEEEFEQVFSELLYENKKIDENVKVYLAADPVYEESYIRDSVIESQNIYTALREYVKTEYTIYNVKINGEVKMNFNKYSDANNYVYKLNREVPKVKTEIVEEKKEELGTITTIELANKIYDDVVSRNKPVIYHPTIYAPTVSTNKKPPEEVVHKAEKESGVWPSNVTYVSSHFGWRWGRMHNGIDIAGPIGSNIYAYKSGMVVFAGWGGTFGNLVKIDHGNGMVTFYAHNSRILVKVGQTVEMGQLISKMGDTGRVTGPHLHFELRINNVPKNPYPYIKGK